MEKPTRSLAKCEGFDIVVEDHGCPFLSGSFKYEDGGGQGFGYIVDIPFIMRFIRALGVYGLKGTKGRSCWVTHTHNNILKIEPLHKEDGVTFNIEKWTEWHKENPTTPCPYWEEDQKKKVTR